MQMPNMASPPYMHSQPGSRYGSPVPSQWSGEIYPGHPAGIIGYDAYGSPVQIHAQPQAYGSPPYSNAMRDPSTPPTSSHSQDEGTAGRKSRRSTPAKRRNKNNGEASKVPELEAPLSELTDHMTDIPVKDMQAWVNRPMEDRLEETKKRNGYITRPMNSFMLYRSAYADRTKRWCEQNNHQVVSAVSGKSWPKEPAHIRDLYNELARIERDNHQKAHPGYKFSPSKTTNGTAAAKKRKDLSDDEDLILTPSDNDDDPDYRPSGGSKRRSRATPGIDQMSVSDMSQYSPYGGMNGMMPHPLAHRPDGMIDQGYGAYYPMHDHLAHGGMIEGGRLLRQAPAGYQPAVSHMGHSVTGLPGTGNYDLLDEHSMAHTPVPFDPSHLDPALMAEYHGGFAGQGPMVSNGTFSEQGFRDFDEDMLAGVGSSVPMSANSVQQWDQQTRSEVEAEFERIMKDHLKSE